MSEVFEWSLRKVIEFSASDAPTPGGGSVSAIVGSLGMSMVAMVGNLTVGKEKYREVEPQVKIILDEAQIIFKKLEELVDQDIAEFGNFMKVLKLPKDTEEQKAERSGLLQKALKGATDTPMEIARVCLQALKLAEQLSTIGNKGAISDVGVGAYVAEAALNSVLLSVDINIPSIKDVEYVAQVVKEKNELIAKAKDLREQAVAQIQARM